MEQIAPSSRSVASASASASTPQPAPVIACRGIVKDFASGGGTIRVLHGIDLDLAAGELAMLVGPSGCGKTTLISIIAGILTPTAGEVRIQGEALARLSDAKKAAFRRRAIGFIFQQYNLLPALTAAENAAIPLLAAKVPESRAVKAAAAVLDRLGMAPHIAKQPRQLSGGQQQRVAIARALVHRPSLIVCDEPTAALDAETGRTVMEMLKSVAVEPGRAVVVVTHDNRIFDFADRIVAMEDGRLAPAPALHPSQPH
ncbi:MAG: ABC transporter ATP-binding protein [Rhodospirillaceae bacterium]|nr:ABC transporter ATP-binding protein [Rhodospirillaceae bacterium]